jgi:hypothetical protein
MAKATMEWRVEALRGCLTANRDSTFWVPKNDQERDWFIDMRQDGYIDGEWRTHYDGTTTVSGFTNLHVTPAGEKLVLDFDAPKIQVEDIEHTLWSYWCLADWRERFGMVSFLFGIFCVGCGVAQIPAIAHLINLIRSL